MLKFREPVLNILISYAYFKADVVDVLRNLNFDYKLVIDSGAFTVWKKGKEIQVQDYCDFLQSLPIKPWRYFNLDVIGNPEKTLKNYVYMLDQGLTPIPIFTRGEDYSMLDHYYNTSDVVGIGGLVGTKNNKNVVKKVMRAVGDKKVHWLGFTNIDFLKHYKPYMCDASSWLGASRFGQGKLYVGNGKQISFSRKDFILRPVPEVYRGLQDLQFDPILFAKKENWSAVLLRQIGAASYIRYMLEVKEKLDVNMFLACGSSHDVKELSQQFKKFI